jgi:hypothetical protein
MLRTKKTAAFREAQVYAKHGWLNNYNVSAKADKFKSDEALFPV